MTRLATVRFALAALGVILLLAAAAELWVGLKADSVANLVRPEMTDQGLAQHRADFESTRTVLEGMNDRVLPALAEQFGMSNAEFQSQIATQYPAVGSLLAQQAQIVPFAEQSLVNLEHQQHNFQQADSLPASGLPPYAGAILDFALGGLLLACAFTLRSDRPRLCLAACCTAVVAAGVLIALPLALNVPSKARSADTVLTSLNPSQAVVDRTRTDIDTADAATAQFDQQLIPDIAGDLGLTRAQFEAELAQSFPDVALGLQQLPAAMQRYDNRLAIREGGASDLRTLKSLPLGALGWFDPAFGLVVGCVGIGAFAAIRRPRAARDPFVAGQASASAVE